MGSAQEAGYMKRQSITTKLTNINIWRIGSNTLIRQWGELLEEQKVLSMFLLKHHEIVISEAQHKLTFAFHEKAKGWVERSLSLQSTIVKVPLSSRKGSVLSFTRASWKIKNARVHKQRALCE